MEVIKKPVFESKRPLSSKPEMVHISEEMKHLLNLLVEDMVIEDLDRMRRKDQGCAPREIQ